MRQDKPNETKILPHAEESEQVLIASAILSKEGLSAFREVSSADFYNPQHRVIAETIHALDNDAIPISYVSIIQRLREDGKAEASGGPEFLTGLTAEVPRAVNFAHYAKMIHDRAASRKLIALGHMIEAAAWDEGQDVGKLAREAQTRLAEIYTEPKSDKRFEVVNDRHVLTIAELGISLEVDRLRREKHELLGELCVKCALPGAKTYDGVMSIADFNLSSARARTERANILAERGGSNKIDWKAYLEELCQRVMGAERSGQPAVDLRTLEPPAADDTHLVDGLALPRRHPSIIFGDGGAAKSYTALYLAGRLVNRGARVALFDWELAGEDHRERLGRLFGDEMPRISYVRCERALVYESDRLIRIVKDERIDFGIYDSVAFACDGPPESAETAGRYFRAVRQIGIGSLHIAHVSKADGSDEKPFGSVFWHNGARATYYAKLAESAMDGILDIGLFNRKSNLGPLRQPVAYRIRFEQSETTFTVTNAADTPDLSEKMSLKDRMKTNLRRGEMTVKELSAAVNAKEDTVRKTITRLDRTFTLLEGGKVALLHTVR